MKVSEATTGAAGALQTRRRPAPSTSSRWTAPRPASRWPQRRLVARGCCTAWPRSPARSARLGVGRGPGPSGLPHDAPRRPTPPSPSAARRLSQHSRGEPPLRLRTAATPTPARLRRRSRASDACPRATPSVSRATRAPLSKCARHPGGIPRAPGDGGRGPQRLPAHGQRAGGERPGERPGSRPGPPPKSPGAAPPRRGSAFLSSAGRGRRLGSSARGCRTPANLTRGCGTRRAAPRSEATLGQVGPGLGSCALR